MSAADELLRACRDGNLQLLQAALQRHDCPSINHKKGVLFRTACARGHISIVQALLSLQGERLVDVNVRGDEAFRSAVKNGHVDVVLELLALTGDRSINVNAKSDDAFEQACAEGHLGIVRVLLALDGDRRVNVAATRWAAFRMACAKGHIDVVRELLSLEGSRRVDVCVDDHVAFREACSRGRVEVVRELLSLGEDREADIHARNDEAFRLACSKGRTEVVKLLLQQSGERSVVPDTAQRALFDASIVGHDSIVQLLADWADSSTVPLQIDVERAFAAACAHKKTAVVRLLLSQAGALAVPTAVCAIGMQLACDVYAPQVLCQLLILRGDRQLDSIHSLLSMWFLSSALHPRPACVAAVLNELKDGSCNHSLLRSMLSMLADQVAANAEKKFSVDDACSSQAATDLLIATRELQLSAPYLLSHTRLAIVWCCFRWLLYCAVLPGPRQPGLAAALTRAGLAAQAGSVNDPVLAEIERQLRRAVWHGFSRNEMVESHKLVRHGRREAVLRRYRALRGRPKSHRGQG